MNFLSGYGISIGLDIGVGVFVLLISFFGLYRGFFKTLFSTCGWFFSLIFAVLLASFMANFLESSFSLTTNISNGLNSKITSLFPKVSNVSVTSDIALQDLQSAGVPTWIANIVINAKGKITLKSTTTVGNVISSIFAYYIVVAISVITLFILFKIFFYILGNIIQKAHTFKTFGKLDRIFGFILGAVEAFIFVDLLIFIISIIPLSFCQKLMIDIENAPFTSFIDKINLFQIIFNALFGSNGLTEFLIKSFK